MSRIQTGQPVFQKGAKPAVSKPIRQAALDDRSRWAALGIGYDDILLALIRSQQSRRAAGLITLEGE